LSAKIVHLESANHDLSKSLTELKEEYQANLEKLKLENTTKGSKIIELDLKWRQAIVDRDGFERVNRVLSEENTVHRAEIDKFTKLLAAKDAKESIPIPKKSRNLVFDSDPNEGEDITLVNEPPDKPSNDDENPIQGFHLGW
jgi:hypothetical protein